MSGVPLIVSTGCEAEALVNKHGVGRAFTPLDADELAAVVVEMANHTGGTEVISRRARELSRLFDLDQIASRAEAVLAAVSEGKPLPAFKR